MSAVQDTTTTAAQPAEAVVERVMTNPTPVAPVEETAVPATTEAAPVDAATTTEAAKPEETVAAPVTAEEKAEEAAVPAVTEAKIAEPITEGQLGYKAPGLLKQFTFSKKEFWLSDSAVTPQNLGLYLRGEKSEVSHPVTAWASQTGKGLLFFNKKGETERTQPAGVIALYDATDLKKASPHEFTFEISGHKHSFKANNDAERDGWYQSIEKSIELGKASKESVRDSEGYKAEIEKLNTPHTIAGAAVAKSSAPKKSTEVDSAEPKRVGSSDGEDEELKKKNNTKSRSTSRGMLNRLKGKKEEHDVKKDEKKEEHDVKKDEKKEEKEAVKEEKAVEKELSKTDETTPVAAAATTEAPVAETTTAEPVAATTAAPVEEKPVEALPVAETATTEEKAKPAKRSSIFGRIPSAWGSLKSPSKEKGEKDAELKPEVPAKDATVSEAAPQLPETATTEPIETPVVAPVTDASKPEITEPAPEATKATDAATPNKEKKNFLSGLSFMNKRDRSVSPSAATKEQPLKTETSAAAPVVPAKDEVVAAEPVKAEEPATEAAPAVVPATTETAEKPVEETATSPNANKRQSMLGNLGRRASKALNRIQPKKENTAPATENKAAVTEETTPAVAEKKADEPTPVVSDAETTAARAVGAPVVDATEENKPEAVGVAPPTQVAASA